MAIEYDAQAHRTNHPNRPPRQNTNVILQYIERDEVHVKQIIETVSRKEVPKSWKITVGVAKDREMKKRKARFFGKLTLEMRLFQVATENNIKHVFKYIPHQTMQKQKITCSNTCFAGSCRKRDPTKNWTAV